MTKLQLLMHPGDAEDFELNSDDYFAMRAIEFHGSAVRDNSYRELVEIGKQVDQD